MCNEQCVSNVTSHFKLMTHIFVMSTYDTCFHNTVHIASEYNYVKYKACVIKHRTTEADSDMISEYARIN